MRESDGEERVIDREGGVPNSLSLSLSHLHQSGLHGGQSAVRRIVPIFPGVKGAERGLGGKVVFGREE
jgi:hypothetical protein